MIRQQPEGHDTFASGPLSRTEQKSLWPQAVFQKNMWIKLKKCWQRCRFVVIYTSLSLRYSKAKPWSWTLAEVALKEAIKNISKSSWQKELNEVLYKSWLTQRSYKELTKTLQAVDDERQCSLKTKQCNRNHAHMISSQMLVILVYQDEFLNKICANKIWNSITWIILRAIQVLQYIYWRVWSWLRTNAGGVLNTCKSNGAKW